MIGFDFLRFATFTITLQDELDEVGRKTLTLFFMCIRDLDTLQCYSFWDKKYSRLDHCELNGEQHPVEEIAEHGKSTKSSKTCGIFRRMKRTLTSIYLYNFQLFQCDPPGCLNWATAIHINTQFTINYGDILQ